MNWPATLLWLPQGLGHLPRADPITSLNCVVLELGVGRPWLSVLGYKSSPVTFTGPILRKGLPPSPRAPVRPALLFPIFSVSTATLFLSRSQGCPHQEYLLTRLALLAALTTNMLSDKVGRKKKILELKTMSEISPHPLSLPG